MTRENGVTQVRYYGGPMAGHARHTRPEDTRLEVLPAEVEIPGWQGGRYILSNQWDEMNRIASYSWRDPEPDRPLGDRLYLECVVCGRIVTDLTVGRPARIELLAKNGFEIPICSTCCPSQPSQHLCRVILAVARRIHAQTLCASYGTTRTRVQEMAVERFMGATVKT